MLRVLRSRVDTLEASFRGQLKPELDGGSGRGEEAAQAEDLPAAFHGRETVSSSVQAQGPPPWRLRAHKRGAPPAALGHQSRVPCVSVRLTRLRSGRCRDTSALWAEASALRRELRPQPRRRSPASIWPSTSRATSPRWRRCANVVCPSPFRRSIRTLEHPETFQFGKGDMVVRIYNKTKELQERGKEWMREVWADAPGLRPGRGRVALRGADSPRDASGSSAASGAEEAFR